MKRIITLIFAFLFALMMLISCAASPNTGELQQDNSSSSSVEEEPSSSPSDDTAEPESGKTGLGDLSGNVTSDSDRKLVYKADYNIETLDYDGDYQKIVSATKKYNGYFSFEDSHGTKPAKYGDSGRISELTIRIPVDHYTAFTEELSTVGQIIQKNQNTEDITGAYLDVESRISLLETQYKKLDAHLQKATKMSDIIELEEEMSKILNELEELRGTRRNYDNMVNYTTINVYLKEVVKLTEVPTSEEGFWDRASEGFNSTAKSVGDVYKRQPMGYVRGGAKDHGRKNQIEGKLLPGQKVVVIEDLISTAGSVIEVVNVLRDAGAEVLGVASIFTYGMKKGLERLKEANVKNISLTDFDCIAEVAAEEGYISPDDIKKLISFRDNPSDESWIGGNK